MAALSIRIDENLRRGASDVFESMGMNLATGVRSYLNFVMTERRMPFAPVISEIPNETTLRAIREPGRRITLEELDKMLGL
ncbi:MAG: type II toxin-antitoxin system RelB/DinJ family antitoxin [Rickettsiales bacterium]|jgi:addiction module RelB/DinJ family antitoxin|nr:type II toxin-antitoxin system RelB/DinJ family antitoxin [Rickettsiales bacterium]